MLSEDRRQKRTCGSCRYRVKGRCRALPPQARHLSNGDELADYPPVENDTPACSLWTHDQRGIQPGD